MIYCLDTNIIVRSLRGQNAAGIAERLAALTPEEVKVPEMVRAELLTGAAKSDRPAHHRELVELFLVPFELLPFAGESPEHYADIRARLEKAGEKIGPNDLVIAATARASGAVLVTGNVSEFSRVPGLLCEEW
jgi:tRNA(fMet)-specific endonuclease VapC